MRIFKYLPALLIALVLLSVIVYIAFYFVFLDLIVDYWWFESLKFQAYFWLRLLYRFFLSGGVTVVFFSIFFFHFWIASRYLSLNPKDEIYLDIGKQRSFERMADAFMSGSIKIYTPLSFILAFMIAIPFYDQWEDALLFFFGQNSGITEPVYGRDVSFYLLSYPIYQLIQKELLITAFILFVLVTVLYWASHVIVPNQEKNLPTGAKIHLSVLMGFVMLFVVWGFLLERYSLLYVDSHEPVFFGPGFVELRYHLPLIWLAILAFLAVCGSAAIFIFSDKPRVKAPLVISLSLFLLFLGMRKIDIIPQLMTGLIVKPNPVKAEQGFMKSNIKATLSAYDLNNIKTIDFPVTLNPTQDIEQWSSQRRFENIPVWDRELLTNVYAQLQGIRPYYSFLNVDEDRYQINDHTQQVNLSAREMNIDRLPKEAQNWENKHLRYTHGYGAVVTPAAQDAGNPIVWYLRDLNMHSPVGMEVDKANIYYGEELYDYAIAPNSLDTVGLTGSGKNLNYQGGGIPIASLFRKLLLAFYLKDEKVFFSVNISDQSRLLIRRNILERTNRLAPFLQLDQDPYLVMSQDRFYWIIDGYTLSKWYPVSKYAEKNLIFRNKEFNYIRNSVKVVVDAYSGETRFYVANPNDVLIQAYRLAYPGVFHDLDEMPKALLTHLRYPRDLFNQQIRIYAKYHQTEPELFYQQAETWDYARAHDKRVMPYYLTLNFGYCDEKEEFVLITPMTPISRDNLSMLGVAGINDIENCSDAYTPQIRVFRFLKDIQVNGPAQVEALIDQNPEISEQMTLWDQHGSKVVYGRMIILPMKQSVLYVQPIYLVSTKTEIPELSRVIVSIGNEVVMDKTLWSAFSKLKNRFLKSANSSSVSTSAESEELNSEPAR
ncbi:MAG: UPF0182 family protein [Methylococcales bacterium]|nr:UPF0182 family protein [Methylococcales bacterium]